MKDEMVTINHKVVFVSISESVHEAKRLRELSGETKYYCSVFKKTGLWVVFEHEENGRKTVVFSLNNLVNLNEEESNFLKNKIESMKGNK